MSKFESGNVPGNSFRMSEIQIWGEIRLSVDIYEQEVLLYIVYQIFRGYLLLNLMHRGYWLS